MFPMKMDAPVMRLHRTAAEGGDDIFYAAGCIYLISAASGGSLRILSADASEPRLLGEVTGLGNMRQIEVSSAAVPGRVIAAVTARECGVYFIDVTEPAAPYVCCHYNSVEFATGINFSGHYAVIGCRSYGVEIIDISKPEAPRHVSVIRAGEVQSVYVADGVLYTGSWGERQVNVFDIKNVRAPRKLATIPLEGRGDGLTVKDGILYAAIGQHRRPATGLDPAEEGFGWGNGFAIWDVHDPASPRQLSVTILPRGYYCCFWDRWDVTLCGHYAIVNNNMLGVWVYDVSDLTSPVLRDHAAFATDAPVADIIPPNNGRPMLLPFDENEQMYAPVTGVAAADGRLYIAMRFENLHIASSEIFAEDTDAQNAPGEEGPDYYDAYPGECAGDAKIVRVNGQAHAVAYNDGLIYAACGMGGINVYDEALEFMRSVPVDGFAMDVRLAAGKLFVAAGKAGVVIMRPEGDSLVELGRLQLTGACAQVVPSPDGRFVMAHTDDQHLTIVDASDPATPKTAMIEHYVPGLMYCRQLSFEGAGGRYYGCYWNSNYTRWYDLSGERPVQTGWKQGRLSFRCGVTGLAGEYAALAVMKGGYTVYDIRDEALCDESGLVRVPGIELYGKPRVQGDMLYVTDRLDGTAVICDISDIGAPRLLAKYNFSGHPDIACPVPGGAVIPLGHQGIALIKLQK